MIKFPKMHIATSVTNRILNIADQVRPEPELTPDAVSARVPAAPTTTMQGAVLDQKLAQPPPDVGEVEKSPDPGATLSGAPLLDTLLTPGR